MNIALQNSISKLSIFISSLCVIHCLSVPIIILLVPTIATFFSETVEHILILSIIPLSAFGFFPSWVNHKNFKLLAGYIISIICLLAGHFLFHESHEIVAGSMAFDPATTAFRTILMVFGALFLAYIIYKNRRHTHMCRNPHHHH